MKVGEHGITQVCSSHQDHVLKTTRFRFEVGMMFILLSIGLMYRCVSINTLPSQHALQTLSRQSRYKVQRGTHGIML